MPAYDSQAVLASAVTVTDTTAGADVSTASGGAMEGLPGNRAHQFLVWFTGAIGGSTLDLDIEEKIGSNYRVIGSARFGTSADPVATYASQGKIYTKLIAQVSPEATAVRYKPRAYTGGSSFVGMNIVAIPFEGSGAPVPIG
jgi:hypothetical protein